MIKAIITGHSRGLGAAMAESLLGRDIAVLGLARQGNPGLSSTFGPQFTEVAIDLADPRALADWLASPAFAGFIDGADPLLLINNAGALRPVGPLSSQNVDDIASTVSLNVSAPLMLAAAVATRAPAEVRIAHISSGAARNPYPGWSVYCATKAALDQHARAVAADGNPALKICSIAPGVIDTDMQAEIRATPAEHFPIKDRFLALKAQGQLSSPADAAEKLVSHLLSDAFGASPIADIREL